LDIRFTETIVIILCILAQPAFVGGCKGARDARDQCIRDARDKGARMPETMPETPEDVAMELPDRAIV